MDTEKACKLTVATAPDYHLDPGATRILVIGDYPTRLAFQDAIADYWPNEDLTLYTCEGKQLDEMDWLFFHMTISRYIVVHYGSHWEWVWPMLSSVRATKLFFRRSDGVNHQALSRSLKLTYPNQVFHNVQETVEAMISLRHK